jgi:hypothetical protein
MSPALNSVADRIFRLKNEDVVFARDAKQPDLVRERS